MSQSAKQQLIDRLLFLAAMHPTPSGSGKVGDIIKKLSNRERELLKDLKAEDMAQLPDYLNRQAIAGATEVKRRKK